MRTLPYIFLLIRFICWLKIYKLGAYKIKIKTSIILSHLINSLLLVWNQFWKTVWKNLSTKVVIITSCDNTRQESHCTYQSICSPLAHFIEPNSHLFYFDVMNYPTHMTHLFFQPIHYHRFEKATHLFPFLECLFLPMNVKLKACLK